MKTPSREQVARSFGAHILIAVAVFVILILGHNAVFGPLFVKPHSSPGKQSTAQLAKLQKASESAN